LNQFKVDALLFTNFVDGEPSLKKINRYEAKSMLENNTLNDLNKHAREFDIIFKPHNSLIRKDKLINDLLNNVECYIFNQNFDNLNASIKIIEEQFGS
jgi:hypothetical protein